MPESDEGAECARALNVPEQPRVVYRRNLIRLATCEVRFPTILALETAAPESFQKAIRKVYPHFELIVAHKCALDTGTTVAREFL